MADEQQTPDPTAVTAGIVKARDAGYSDTDIADHLADSLPGIKEARKAGYSDKDIIGHLAGDKAAAAAPSDAPSSGAVAGFEKGTADLVGAKGPDNYVPAKPVVNGVNPLNWNWSQLPQKVAEAAPGLTQDILAAKAAAAVGGRVGGTRGALIGGAVGGLGSAVERTLSPEAKQFATERTGDPNATPSATDYLKATGTSVASGVGSMIPAARFAGPAISTGAKTLGQAALKYLTTAGAGAVGSGVSSAVGQVAHTGTVNPTQLADDALTGGVTSGAFAAPRGVTDAINAKRVAPFAGPNQAAAEGYASRLVNNAGSEGLGNAKRDFAAQENTKKGLKNELQDVSDSGMPQDTANALALAKQGAPLTNDHVDAIEQSDPNAGFLARQLRMAQLAEKYGSYDPSNKGWSGGLSGFADKYAVRPFKAHLLIGGAAAALGAHSLGTYSLPFLGAAAGGYTGARVVDGLTGMRSPAQSFAKNFATLNAQTRAPTAPQSPPSPPQAPQGQPWGPRPPTTGPTGPQVQAPTPSPGAQGPWGPKPMPTSSGVPNVAAPVAPKPPITPGNMPWKSPTVATLPTDAEQLASAVKGVKAMRASQAYLANLKASSPQGTQPWKAPQVANLGKPWAAPQVSDMGAPAQPTTAPINPMALPKDITGQSKALVSALAKVQKMKAAATGIQAPATQQQAGPAAPAAPSGPKTISKGSDGDVKTNFYRPLAGSELKYTSDMPIESIARDIANTRLAGKPQGVIDNYAKSVADTHTERRQIVQNLLGIDTNPAETAMLKALTDQLHNRNDKASASAAIEHTANQLSAPTAAKLRKGFNDEAKGRIWADKKKKSSSGTTKKGRDTRKEKGDPEIQAVAAE